MTRQPEVLRLNGACRRRPMREVGPLLPWMNLYHAKVSQCHYLENIWFCSILRSQRWLVLLSHLVMIHALLSNNLAQQVAEATAKTIIECLIHLINLQDSSHRNSTHLAFLLGHMFYAIARPHVLRHHPRRRISGSSIKTLPKYISPLPPGTIRNVSITQVSTVATSDGFTIYLSFKL